MQAKYSAARLEIKFYFRLSIKLFPCHCMPCLFLPGLRVDDTRFDIMASSGDGEEADLGFGRKLSLVHNSNFVGEFVFLTDANE